MTGTTNDNPGNFANRPTEEVKEIASKGGKASHSGGVADTDSGKQHDTSQDDKTSSTSNDNPGNFANRPKEDAVEAGRKGGSK
ncbi:hypothetical protein SCAR479_02216 [Seiridium cardinale]|uniref:Conidiation-specific protein 10 n=1 Tax=Seiridium cardinale TaxID=138064 RepID=A0ABR2X5B1_9PEZI